MSERPTSGGLAHRLGLRGRQGPLMMTVNGALASAVVAVAGLVVVIVVLARSTRGRKHIGGHGGTSL